MQKDVVYHMCGKKFSIGSTAGRDTSVGRRLGDLLVSENRDQHQYLAMVC